MKLSVRQGFVLFIVGLGLIGLTLLVAPSQSQLQRGSTYGRYPADYGAWYAYMEAQGVPIQRWRQPVEALLAEVQTASERPTLIQIYPTRSAAWLTAATSQWIEAGYRLIIVGVASPAVAPTFTTALSTDSGPVTLQTRRRHRLQNDESSLLADTHGAIAWRQAVEPGEMITVGPPDLAANAYQNEPGNLAFLAKIAGSGPIWVDEYLHGYRDREEDSTAAESVESWADYLLRTPFAVLVIQIGAVVAIAVLMLNRRFGPAIAIATPPRNNSAAYIEALAQVLRKADSRRFVQEVIGREERLQLQKALGLGNTPVTDAVLLQAWQQHTGQAAATLADVLQQMAQPLRTEPDLLDWVRSLQHLRQGLTRPE